MSELYVIAITALIGIVAWTYQAALGRQDRRVAQYFAILENLSGFMVGAISAGEKKENTVAAARILWLIAPPAIVRAGNDFFRAVEGSDAAHVTATLNKLVLDMRRDTMFRSVIWPRFRWNIVASDIQLFIGK